LNNPDGYRHLDKDVFDSLVQIVRSGCRSLTALEKSGLLPGAVFHHHEVPTRSARLAWIDGMTSTVRECDLVFADPDNGIEGKRLIKKQIAISEIRALRGVKRILVLYHHQRRRPAHEEADLLTQAVIQAGWSPVELVRFRLFSSRFYVIAGHDSAVSERLAEFVNKWGDRRVEHFPIRGA
jgi:hypothetical protein